MDVEIKNDLLNTYLQYVEDTESPRIFHIWSLISGIGAALGRRSYLPFGTGQIFPNNYVLLVGPPGVRKSTAINTVQKLLKLGTSLRFAPDDTSGARQGLIMALRGEIKPDAAEDKLGILSLLQEEAEKISVQQIGELPQEALADAHIMYVCASEFGSFIGINSLDMTRFLTKIWDGEDYEYKIKNEFVRLTNPLLSLLGGTTPSVIAESLPPSAIGGGYTSRHIMVFAANKYKNIAFPKSPDERLRDRIVAHLTYIYQHINGEFDLAAEAKNMLTELYDYKVKINDTRFVYYMERRFTHLLKTCMAFAATRKSQTILPVDVKHAHDLLEYTEKFMVDALGEYGLSALSAAKQKLLEFLQYQAPAPVPLLSIMAMLKKDMKIVDIHNSLADLSNAGKIKRISTEYGDAYIYLDKNKKLAEKIEKMVSEALLEDIVEHG